MSRKTFTFVAFIAVITAFDVEIERPEVEFYDKELFKYLNISVRRASRKSPYSVTFDMYNYKTLGNNVSVFIQLLENLSGRYQPTIITTEWKMCEFHEKEPYLGQMLAKQFPPNISCPFKPGRNHLPGIGVSFEKFPYALPFTWPYKTIRVRLDQRYHITGTKQAIAKFNFYAKIKLDNK